MTLSSFAATLATLAVLVVPPAAPRPAQHNMALLKGHAADGLGLGLGMGGMGFGRPGLALPYLGQDDDDLPIIGKRSVDARGAVANLVARQDLGSQDSADYGTSYDEFPMIVPRRADKRAAIMLDRIFGMMKDAVNGDPNLKAIAPDDRMDLQRRGQQKGRVYWRCYFNAVTCFRRK